MAAQSTLHLPLPDDYKSLRALYRKCAGEHEGLVEASHALLEKARREKRDLNAEEQAKFDRLDAKMAAMANMYERINAKSQPMLEAMEPATPWKGEASTRSSLGFDARKVFGAARPSPFDENLGDFYQQLVSGRYSPELQSMRASAAGMSEGVPSEGGFALPETLSFQMLNAVAERSLILPMVRSVQCGASRSFTGFDNLTRSASGALGGLEPVWTEEAGTIAEDAPQLRTVKLVPKKLALLVSLTSELAQDAENLQNEVQDEMARNFAFKLDQALLRGTGSGQVLGALNDPALLSVAKQSGQAAGSVVISNFTDMIARVHPSALSSAVWIVSSSVLSQLYQMTLGAGTAVSLVFDPRPSAANPSSVGTLLGRPIFVSEHASAVGEKLDVLLASWENYIFAANRTFRVDTSSHLHFQTDQLAMRGIGRFDGQSMYSGPVTPARGPSQSWAVTLDARA